MLLTDKAEEQKDRSNRALTGQLPADADEIARLAAAASASKAPITPSVQTTSTSTSSMSDTPATTTTSSRSALPPAAIPSDKQSQSQSGKWARPSRVSQALFETDKAMGDEEGGAGAGGRVKPMKVSEFGRRLERAERLQKEEEQAK